MANAALISSSNRLDHSMKALRERWEATRATWNDKVRRDFEERHLLPLESAVNSALDGMHKMAEVLDQVRRDCSDRNESW